MSRTWSETVAETSFGERNNGGAVEVARGSTFKIQLPENPTTGYQWSRPAFDGAFLALATNDFVPSQDGRSGSGGMREYVLRAKGAGQTTFRVASQRPWDTSSAPAAVFELLIHIVK
jgi:inhibitor of cysteine peptidase